MAKTLLDYVQEILSALDSAEVNSLSDTSEALQVAQCVKSSYEYLVSILKIPEQRTFFELEASGNTALPLVMYLPSRAVSLDFVKYNTQEDPSQPLKYCTLKYLPVSQFMERSFTLDSTQDNVIQCTLTLGGDTIDFLGKNDAFPEFYTSFDDRTLLFNSYRADLDSTLVKNKTLCYGLTSHEFELRDDFVPTLDARHSALLLNEAKVQAFTELKQIGNPVAAARARKGLIDFQRTKHAVERVNPLDRVPDYGRRK